MDGRGGSRIDFVHERVQAASRTIAVPAHVDAGAKAARRGHQRHVLFADHGLAVLAPLLDELGAALLLDVVVRGGGVGLVDSNGPGASYNKSKGKRQNGNWLRHEVRRVENVDRVDPRCSLPQPVWLRNRALETTRSSAIAAPTATRGSSSARSRRAVSSFTRLWRRPSRSRSRTAFQKKYGIKVVLWRGLSDQVVQRAITEARAGGMPLT